MKICTECQIEMRLKENGIALVVMATYGPIRVYSADLYECLECGATGIFGIANEPEMMGEGVPSYLIFQTNKNRKVIEYWLNKKEKDLSSPLSYYLEKGVQGVDK